MEVLGQECLFKACLTPHWKSALREGEVPTECFAAGGKQEHPCLSSRSVRILSFEGGPLAWGLETSSVRRTPSSTPSPIFLSPILSWLERPCRSPEPPRGPPKDPLGLRQRHHHLPGSKQDPKTQADISFTKSSRASWPPLLRNQMPGNSGWPAKSPCLRGAGLADMCLCPSGLQSPTSPPARGTPAQQGQSLQLLAQGWESQLQPLGGRGS